MISIHTGEEQVQPDTSGEVIYKDTNIKIIYKGVVLNSDGYGDLDILFYVENNSGMDISIWENDDLSINGERIDDYYEEDNTILSDSVTLMSFIIYEDGVTLDNIETIEFSFELWDSSENKSIIEDSGPLQITL